jgi:hypothetical protein
VAMEKRASRQARSMIVCSERSPGHLNKPLIPRADYATYAFRQKDPKARGERRFGPVSVKRPTAV